MGMESVKQVLLEVPRESHPTAYRAMLTLVQAMPTNNAKPPRAKAVIPLINIVYCLLLVSQQNIRADEYCK
jgi:hypothetical protein